MESQADFIWVKKIAKKDQNSAKQKDQNQEPETDLSTQGGCHAELTQQNDDGPKDCLRKMKGPIFYIGMIYNGDQPLGTGTLEFNDDDTIVLITSCGILLDPFTKDLLDDLWFICGQHGNKQDAMWKGQITLAMVPNKDSKNYNFALARIEIPESQKVRFLQWKEVYAEERHLIDEYKIFGYFNEDNNKGIRIYGYPSGELSKIDSFREQYMSYGTFGDEQKFADIKGGMVLISEFIDGQVYWRFCGIHVGSDNSCLFNPNTFEQIQKLVKNKLIHVRFSEDVFITNTQLINILLGSEPKYEGEHKENFQKAFETWQKLEKLNFEGFVEKSQGYIIEEDIDTLIWIENKTCKSGNQYSGTLTENGQFHGFGRRISQEGQIYEGFCYKNKKHGYFRTCFKDGQYAEAIYEHGFKKQEKICQIL